MNTIIARIITRFRPAVSVATLTAGLQKTVAKLDAHAKAEADRLAALEDQIAALNAQADAAANEVMLANNVRTNVARLVGAPEQSSFSL